MRVTRICLTWKDVECLRSQTVTLKNYEISLADRQKSTRGKHLKYPPYAFSEQGVAMLSSVLRSKRAIQVNIIIMRAFVRMRQLFSAHKKIIAKLNKLEQRTDKNTGDIQLIFNAIRKMLAQPESKTKRIGFLSDK
ncbi:MAG: ORF6N domain-containing protein [Candidatus Margulisbacteria bacterium]|nr:ORF6N domain-containing protein [Candidatus Margulisiibacteriota bacterium]